MAATTGQARENEPRRRTLTRRTRECEVVRDPAVWLWAVVAVLALLPLGAALV